MAGPPIHKHSTFLTGGRSLHPLQRQGSVPAAGFAVKPAGGPVSLDNGASVPPTPLTLPPVQNVNNPALSKGNVG